MRAVLVQGGAEGGGIYSKDGDVVVSNCTLRDNRLDGWYPTAKSGGGIWADGACQVLNCVIAGNDVYAAGGGSYVPYATGGGVHLGAGAHALRNCLLYGNNARTTANSTPKGSPTYPQPTINTRMTAY